MILIKMSRQPTAYLYSSQIGCTPTKFMPKVKAQNFKNEAQQDSRMLLKLCRIKTTKTRRSVFKLRDRGVHASWL